MSPAAIALLAALVPFLAVHIAYLNSIVEGSVPACFPYIEGCLTISRAARNGDSIHIFRAMMLPTSTLFVAYWLIVFGWLTALGQERTRSMQAMRTLGVTGALFLILYVTYLGTEGKFYEWMRRYGVTFYFSFTALAQIFLTKCLFELLPHSRIAPLKTYLQVKLGLCIFQWSSGLLSLPLGVLITDNNSRDIMQNVIEWNFALAMNAYFFVSFLMLRKTGLKLNFVLMK